MKVVSTLFLAALTCTAQQAVSTYTFDVNGARQPGASIRSGPGNQRSETVRNLNGRSVPVNSVEERVISEAGGVRIVEQIIRRYDANGNPSPPEKVRIEERKAGETVNVQTTVMRADLNGRYQLAERTHAESRKAGDVTTTTTTVERPTLNGAMDLLERRNETTRESKDGSTTTAIIQRRDNNGRFYDTERQTVEVVKAGDKTTENAAVYQALADGNMRLVHQTVSRSVKATNGSETTERDVFVGGLTSPQLRERQIIEKTPRPGGAVETVSVQRPADQNSTRLTPPQKVAETVCTGKCS